MKHLTICCSFLLVLFVPVSLAFAEGVSKEGMAESGRKAAQSGSSGHIWFTPGQKGAVGSTATVALPYTAQGKAGIIGDCGVKGEGRDKCINSPATRSKSGVSSSDPIPDPRTGAFE